ncbi:MAG TPA: SDR family oxidoreductase [Tepidisphaeraceae bacterium]|jgi:NAD(P)-dependent dehydrogenase (short-subunit alcohol dehydrogenase family)|nr:SDR family oxidoreductase [Tepidisphaeraceae bacterium]
MFKLTDKIAVVTGAASGIGEAIARVLAAAGAEVVVEDRKVDEGKRVVESIRAAGGKARFIELDVADEKSCQAAGREVGKCDVLINNAGIGHVGTILTTSGEEMDQLYGVNVKGVHFMSKVFAPGMVERRAGSIVNLASIGGIVGVRDRYAYCMTKFAVVGLTKSMALDLAEHKVRVNCICPGRVHTPFVEERLKEYADPKKAYEEMASTQILKRMGRPEEIAAAALYLASDEAAFVTGSALIIDGGFSTGK